MCDKSKHLVVYGSSEGVLSSRLKGAAPNVSGRISSSADGRTCEAHHLGQYVGKLVESVQEQTYDSPLTFQLSSAAPTCNHYSLLLNHSVKLSKFSPWPGFCQPRILQFLIHSPKAYHEALDHEHFPLAREQFWVLRTRRSWKLSRPRPPHCHNVGSTIDYHSGIANSLLFLPMPMAPVGTDTKHRICRSQPHVNRANIRVL